MHDVCDFVLLRVLKATVPGLAYLSSSRRLRRSSSLHRVKSHSPETPSFMLLERSTSSVSFSTVPECTLKFRSKVTPILSRADDCLVFSLWSCSLAMVTETGAPRTCPKPYTLFQRPHKESLSAPSISLYSSPKHLPD